MDDRERFFTNTHFRLLKMGSVDEFLHRKFVLFAVSLWASLSTLFSALFRFLDKTMFRVKENKNCQTNNLNCKEHNPNCVEQQEAEAKESSSEFDGTMESDDLEEKDSPKFFFKFQFQTYRENDEPIFSDSAPPASTNNRDFLWSNDFSHYLEEPVTDSLSVKELNTDSNDNSIGNKEISNDRVLSDEESVHGDIQVNSEDSKIEAEVTKKPLEAKTFIQEPSLDNSKEVVAKNDDVAEKVEEETFANGKKVDVENNELIDDVVSVMDAQFLSEKDLISADSDSDSITSSYELISRFVASTSDEFLSDKDFEDEFELTRLRDICGEEDAENFDQADSDILEEVERLDESNFRNSGNLESETLYEEDFQDSSNSGRENSSNDAEAVESSDGSKKNLSASDSEDSNGLETLWEHQDFIEQLKMELKKVRATGLPTILEEDESPKMDDLKPWKIEEKLHHEDTMSGLHKFYRKYSERMRKFDILNFQKMYAMGFLQSKDPLQVISSHKALAPGSASLLQKFLPCKRKESGSDPMTSFIRELHRDLEMIYVGQMCLSWEFLQWQYEKAIELWESDPYSIRRYNEVAGEFQQFQVLMQRFVENEPFEGPRVQNYIKKRCVLRNLLQVPVIRVDSVKDKKARAKGKDDYTITSDMLIEIMEESIRIFWQFVRADKDAYTVIQKGRKGTQVEPQDPSELELLTEVKTSLQKKEKKLKEILRSGNCIVRKFKKHRQEEDSPDYLYFFSQVDMKLVARVLNMSKTTMDQLLWCQDKLSRINFVSRRLHVEPSFLLFPCS